MKTAKTIKRDVFSDVSPEETSVFEVRIKGLTYSHMDGEYGVFLMHGVERRQLDMGAIEQAIGRSIHPTMADDLAAVIRRYDIIDVLADRMTL